MICIVTGDEESRIAIAAPKPAPADTPKISGDTSGFWNIPWYDAPEIDNAAPTIIGASILGSLISQTTVYMAGERFVFTGRIAITTSKGEIG